MIVLYSYDKLKNLVVFICPKVTISGEGDIIFYQHTPNLSIVETRHMVHTKYNNPGITLGYLDTIYVNDKIISQKFFPMGNVGGFCERRSKEQMKGCQSFEELYTTDKSAGTICDRRYQDVIQTNH